MSDDAARTTDSHLLSTAPISLSGPRSFGPIDSRYLIRRHLRDGGSASVYEAYDQDLRRLVAVKRYPRVAAAQDSAPRYWQEARLTGWLQHPNIVPVYDMLQREAGSCDLVMKLVEGETLGERILRSMALSHDADTLEQYLRDLLKVCDAIAFAHSRGVVHRDLKPANIMVGAHGEVYVMDWGIAKVLPGGGPQSEPEPNDPPAAERDDRALLPVQALETSAPATSTQRGSLVGTPAYMAPEQASGNTEDTDTSTDIFGLGAVLYEILTGRPPYDLSPLSEVLSAARERRLVPPGDLGSGRIVSPELRRVCLKAMALRKEDRFQTVAEFAEDIRGILRGGGWFEILRFAPGEVIVREGDASDSAFVLKSGQCRVTRASGVDQQELRMIGPGEVFGEVGLVTGALRSATVIAEEQVEVQVLSSRSLSEGLVHHGLIGKFLGALAKRFLDIDQRLFDARKASKDRVE
ncbi:MAG: hypothetical protein RJA70_1675 [Pseudomonadota bacterium]|jgi:serine/threonine-protein kinase